MDELSDEIDFPERRGVLADRAVPRIGNDVSCGQSRAERVSEGGKTRQDGTGRSEPTKSLDAQARDVEGDEEAAAAPVADVCDGAPGVVLPACREL